MALSATQIIYGSYRLKYPMKRAGERERVSGKEYHDEALDTVAEKLLLL